MKTLAVLTTLLASVTVAVPAAAEGGYFSGVLGARAAGRAGAFTAKADDLTAVTFNPAGLAKLETTLIQIGNLSSYDSYTFTRAPTLDYGNPQNGMPPRVVFDEVRSGRPWQVPGPLVGAASKLGLRDWGFALAAFAAPGVSREEFPLGGGQRYMMVSREAIILNYAASAAWKLRDVFGIGATLQWIHVPRLTYSLVIDGSPFAGAANPVSSQLDMLATTNGSDAFTFNAIVGAWFRPTPSLELGLAGQVVPANMVARSRLSVVPISPAFGGTVVLTRDGVPADDVRVTLPLPLLARAGGRYRRLVGERELYDIELDLVYETWSRVRRFTLATAGLQANFQGQVVDLDRIDIEKQWRDTLAVKLGGDYAVIPDRITLRGGATYETAVAGAPYANVDFPGGQRIGAAVGMSVFIGHWELVFAYQLLIQPSVSIAEADARVYQQVPGSPCRAPYTDPTTCNPNTLGRPAPAVNAGAYGAYSHFASVGILYRYGL